MLAIASAFLVGVPQGQSAGEPITKIPDDATAKTLAGKTVSIADYKGKLVFMNIWRIDCIACLMEIPILNKLQEDYSSQGFTVIGVDVDREKNKQVEDIVKQAKIRYPVWLAHGQPLNKYVDVQYTPFLVVLGPEGEVIGTLLGAFPDYAAAVSIMNQARDIMKKGKVAKSP